MLYRLLLALAALLSPAATQPATPPPDRTMLGASGWLSYYYQVANDSHHSQNWAPLLQLHADGCGRCDAIPNGSRLAGPGDIRRSPIVGGPSPVHSDGDDRVEIVTAVERVLPGVRIQERYIDRVTLTWRSGPRPGWRVEHLSFEPYE
jgi:hypothetical protein